MMIQNNFLNSLFKLCALVLASSLFSGCIWVDDTSDLKRFVADIQAKPKGKIEPLPEFKPYHSFVYQGASLRDPFVPMVRVESSLSKADFDQGQDIEPDFDRPKSYLEQFAIDQLAMVGTIGKADTDSFWVLIRDDNGEIHRVKEGDRMGLDYGEVVKVDERTVEMVEIISNGRGGWMLRPRNIELTEQ